MLLVAALLVPVAFVASGIGAWLAHGGRESARERLIAMPWVYAVAFVPIMLLSFKQQSSRVMISAQLARPCFRFAIGYRQHS